MMRIRLLRMTTLFGVAASIVSLAATRPYQKPDTKPEKIIVMVEEVQGHVTYKINSEPAKNLLGSLGRLIEQRGKDTPVIVLIEWNVPVREVFDVERTASKAGFEHIRSFVFAPDKGYMSELKIGRGIPFSTDPDVD